MPEKTTRREFLQRVAAVAGGSAFLLSFPFAKYFSIGLPRPSSLFPIGNRVIRIRVLNDDQSWFNALGSYTPYDILAMLDDLKPTTINRYFSGPQNPDQLLPALSGEKQMTVRSFLQASLNACENPNNTSIFPRISYNIYVDNGWDAFFDSAKQIFKLCSSLDPPQTLLSVDNYGGDNPTVMTLAQGLFKMGWKGLSWDACGAIGPKGYATFAMICVDPETGIPNMANMATLKNIGGYGEFEAQIDFPGPMNIFASDQSPDGMASMLTSLAAGQASGGYHFMYPILQPKSAETPSNFVWDSTQIYTAIDGQYKGQTLYQVMKSLMERYN